MIEYKMDVLEKLKKAGYSSAKLRKEKLLSESTIQKLRSSNTSLTLDTIDTICRLLDCQPNDIIRYKKDREE